MQAPPIYMPINGIPIPEIARLRIMSIIVLAHWKDDPRTFEANCLVIPTIISDRDRDLIMRRYENVLYVFEEGELIVGEHLDFVVLEVLSEQSFHEEVLQ